MGINMKRIREVIGRHRFNLQGKQGAGEPEGQAEGHGHDEVAETKAKPELCGAEAQNHEVAVDGMAQDRIAVEGGGEEADLRTDEMSQDHRDPEEYVVGHEVKQNQALDAEELGEEDLGLRLGRSEHLLPGLVAVFDLGQQGAGEDHEPGKNHLSVELGIEGEDAVERVLPGGVHEVIVEEDVEQEDEGHHRGADEGEIKRGRAAGLEQFGAKRDGEVHAEAVVRSMKSCSRSD